MTNWQYRVSWALFFLPLAVLVVFYILLNFTSDHLANELSFWGQLFTSNWPSWKDGGVSRDGFWYSFGIAFRATLAYAPIAGMVGIFWKLVRVEKEQRMNIYDALQSRDRAIERQILNLLPEKIRAASIEPLRAAIREAAEMWEKDYLPNVVGSETAQRIENRLRERV
jgi:hypothetical protein